MEHNYESIIQTKQNEYLKFTKMNKTLRHEIFLKEKTLEISQNKLKNELLDSKI